MKEKVFCLEVTVSHPTIPPRNNSPAAQKYLSQIQKIIGELSVDLHDVLAIGHTISSSPKKISIRVSAQKKGILMKARRILAAEFKRLELPVKLEFKTNELPGN